MPTEVCHAIDHPYATSNRPSICPRGSPLFSVGQAKFERVATDLREMSLAVPLGVIVGSRAVSEVQLSSSDLPFEVSNCPENAPSGLSAGNQQW